MENILALKNENAEKKSNRTDSLANLKAFMEEDSVSQPSHLFNLFHFLELGFHLSALVNSLGAIKAQSVMASGIRKILEGKCQTDWLLKDLPASSLPLPSLFFSYIGYLAPYAPIFDELNQIKDISTGITYLIDLEEKLAEIKHERLSSDLSHEELCVWHDFLYREDELAFIRQGLKNILQHKIQKKLSLYSESHSESNNCPPHIGIMSFFLLHLERYVLSTRFQNNNFQNPDVSICTFGRPGASTFFNHNNENKKAIPIPGPSKIIDKSYLGF